MNRIYKVIYSKARQCYIVVSELAKSNHKSSQQGADHTNTPALARIIAVALAAGALTWGSVPGVSWAADTTQGSGDGVAIGTGSNAPKAENVAIGKGASISYSGGVGQPSTGDIVIGGGAHINNYIDQGGGIAIGANSFVENMTGGLERSFDFKQAGYKSFWGVPYGLPKDPTKMVTGVAIGQNTYARSGSIMLGTHNYQGDLGDVTVDSANTKAQNMSLFSTTLGANSYSNGLFSSVTGAYSIASSDYNGGENASKNFGATITGSLNSIESDTSSSEYSGVANSIVGVANRTSNSNGSLIFGAGNEIKNSITNISAPTSGGDSAKALQDSLMKKVQRGNSGGATLVIGGGNKADYTQKTQILGVNNTVTGTEKNISDYNMIDGFGNTITGASHLYTIGTNNEITNTKNTILAGDDYTNVSGLTDSVIIGNNRVRGKDDKAEFAYFSNQKNIVSIGNKNVLDSTDGSISIGNNNFMWRSGGQPEKYGYDTGNVAIGNNTYINSYLNQGDSIVIGKNATAMNMGGSLEKAFAFGTPEGKDYSGSIAIGQNSYARSGSTMIGIHNYQGKLGDLDIDFTKGKNEGSSGIANYQESIDATTIGNNSYNNGVFSTVVGSYTAVSGLYHNQKWGEKPYGVQNFGAAVVGSLNSVEGLTSTEHNTAGMADSILGSANRTKNANGTIMVGAGNVVEDSINDFDASEIKTKDGIASPNALSDAMRTSIKSANGGGAAAIVGNGNEVTSSTNVSVLGSKNTLTKTKSAQVLGDNREVTDTEGAVIIGSASGTTPLKTDKKNVTILGYNANATAEGGVAIGSGSIANVGAGQKGYYVKHDQRSEEGQGYPFKNNDSAWISRAGAVSVGDTTNADQSKWITRQITGVAAGTKDTDAVNVAQLKNSQTRYYSVYDPGDNWLGIFPQIPNWEKYKNENNQGAQGYWSMAAGFGTSTGGIASTVIGSMSKIDNKWTDGGPNGTQGATAVSLGTLNLNLSDQVTDKEVNSDDPIVTIQSKEDSGVANSIVGQANLTKNSNGALIYGAGNIVTDSYRRVFSNGDNDWKSLFDQDMESLLSNPEKAIKTIGKVADISGGKAMVIGGGNVVDKAYDSQVMGVGNTITGDAINFNYKESPEVSSLPEDTWDEKITKEVAKDADVWTQYMESIRKNGTLLNYVDGYYSTLKNGQNDYLIGTANEVTGDDASKNKSNIVFGDYHKLKNGSNNIIIGSADGAVVEKAKGYNEDDEYGIKTSQEVTGQKKHEENLVDAVMIGHNADVQKNGGVALGAGSVASGDKDVVGYDSANVDHSEDTTGVWKSKAAAVSVGDKNLTRQITNVAAGKDDTDAVNVAQLKNLQTTLNGDVAKAATEVKGDKNVKATPSTVDGHTLYTLGLADTVTIGSDNAKAVKIDGTTGEVSGLSNITWDKDTDYSKSTKAATEAQLQKAMKDVQTAAESKDTDTHVKAGTYAVTTVKDAAGKDTQGVALDVVNKAGTSVGKVTITDVAKASDVGDVSKLATGSNTVVDAINNVNTKVDTVDKKVDTVDKKVGDLQYGAEGQTNVVTNGDSVTKAIGDLDKAIGNASTEAGKHTIVSTKDRNLTVENVAKKGEAANYQLALNKDITVDSVTAKTVTSDTVKTKNLSVSESASIGDVTINKGNQGTIDGLKNTAWDAKNITSGRAATEDQVKAATKNAVNYDDDTSKTITLREDTTIKNVANTTIEQGSKNAVNAGTVYNETRVKQDGKYVKASNTAGQNITALDNQVASNASNITNINGRVNNLDSKINKVGAGAAALAALHPLDFDPEDKWDFAVGYGNYRDANSVAVGAFYRPDDDTMFSVGTNFGNGENMINAGVSFKFGPKGKSQVRLGSTQEITELRATVARQDDQLKKQDNEIKELKAMVQQLMAKQDKQATTK